MHKKETSQGIKMEGHEAKEIDAMESERASKTRNVG